MSQEQINKNNHIVDILNDIQDNVHDIQKEADPLNTIEQRAVSIIRALRQGIERLRRIAGEGDTLHVPYPRTLAEANQWPKDELAFVMWQFWDWVSGEGCPAETCKDFPCKYRQKTKADCEENLQNGDLDEEGYKLQQENLLCRQMVRRGTDGVLGAVLHVVLSARVQPCDGQGGGAMSTLLGGYKHHKARKQHRCWLCGKPIMPGEIYVASFVVDGGDTSYDREHVHCHNIMSDKCQGCKDYDGECWSQDCFDEAITEHACKKCGGWRPRGCTAAQIKAVTIRCFI